VARGLADSVKFLEARVPSAAVGGEIGRERGDGLEEVLGSGTEIEGYRLHRLSATRRRLGRKGFCTISGGCGFWFTGDDGRGGSARKTGLRRSFTGHCAAGSLRKIVKFCCG
jgi:hypothetical protein